MKEKRKIDSFLGADIEFEGKLKFSETVRIDGQFKGEISAKGSLIVGESAFIRSDIHAFSVMVSGEIHGNIFADHKVEIPVPGKVFGDIEAPIIVMEKGAVLRGMVRVHPEKGGDEGVLDVSAAGEDRGISDPSLGMIHGIVMGGPPQGDGHIDDKSALEEERGRCKPIKNAKVVAVCGTSLKKKTQTDSSGRYQLTDLEHGVWKLNVMSKGYEVGEATVEIYAGGVYEQNFV
jgi:cytoskeletal protein CcmA (bactofilin family)